LLRYKKIFLGGPCNNDCTHCLPGWKDSPQVDFAPIRKLIENTDSDNIEFYGGEPTLRSDLGALITTARDEGYRRIKLRSNGRALANPYYLDDVMRAGCSLFDITLWGSHPHLHDRLTRVPDSFRETMSGLQNLSSAPYEKFISVRIPLCRENISDLEQTVVTALNVGVQRIILAMRDYTLSFESVRPHIANGINIGIFNRVWTATEGIPFCLMQGLEQHVGELFVGWESLTATAYRKHKRCTECVYDTLCPGAAAEHVERFGGRELTPVRSGARAEEIKALYEEKSRADLL